MRILKANLQKLGIALFLLVLVISFQNCDRNMGNGGGYSGNSVPNYIHIGDELILPVTEEVLAPILICIADDEDSEDQIRVLLYEAPEGVLMKVETLLDSALGIQVVSVTLQSEDNTYTSNTSSAKLEIGDESEATLKGYSDLEDIELECE